MGSAAPRIGQHPQSLRAIAKHKLDRFACVVRYRKRLHGQIADHEHFVAVDYANICVIHILRHTECPCG